jgi:hypothetical protein
MHARLTIISIFTVAIAAARGANTAWQHKEFSEWTLEDARTIMRDSPWAQRIPMPAAARPSMVVVEPAANGASPPTASLGNPSNTTTGVNMSAAYNPGSTGGADTSGMHNLPTTQTPSGIAPSAGAPVLENPITIVWASALPVRLAILKMRSGSSTPPEEQIARASRPHDDYTIAVSGLPAPDPQSDPKALAKRAFLSVKGRSPVLASDSNYRKIGDSNVYFFRFPRQSLVLSDSDGQVEFKATVGSIEVKKAFALKEMRYKGQLAL